MRTTHYGDGPHSFGKIVPISYTCVSFWKMASAPGLFISRSDFITPRKGATSVPNIVGLSFLFVVYSSLLLPFVKDIPSIGIPEDFQLSMGPSLSKGTLGGIFLVVMCYMPSISIFVVILSFLIEQLWAPILASTTMLPSGIRYHAGQFFRVVKRGTP